MSTEHEDRIVDLEIRIAHQERAIEELGDALLGQQRLIDALHHELEVLRERLRAIPLSNVARPDEETPPPHY
ncbi:MAG: SlyX family protein [Chromatiales bacterium]|jgi:SlyX protein|nr:SlyX family protein [Chromatiales bacterium]MDX9768673.1 SlyX family protein [Ectothiorhodospiraceae bacterium]